MVTDRQEDKSRRSSKYDMKELRWESGVEGAGERVRHRVPIY